jgi:ribosomal protein S27AE
MPRPVASKPFANVTYLFPTLVHCPTCDVLQAMHINGVQPAFHCGKDAVFYRCTRCGNETTMRLSEEGSPEGSEIQWPS